MGRMILGPVLAGSLAMVASGCVVRPAEQLSSINAYNYTNKVVQMCTDGKYDFDTKCLVSNQAYESMDNSVFVIKKKAIYMADPNAPAGFKEGFKKWRHKKFGGDLISMGQGSAIMYKDGYMLTATHILGFAPLRPFQLTWKKDKKKYWLYPVQTFYSVEINGKEYQVDVVAKPKVDVSLVKVRGLPKGMNFPKIKFGKLADIRAKNLVYLVGNSLTFGVSHKKGIVSRTNADVFVKHVKKHMPPNYPKTAYDGKHFMIQADGQPGDSGGFVYLIRDGKPELGGMLVLGHQTIGVILSADSILKAMKPHFKRLGLE